MSVTKIAWFDEGRRFVVGYSDGVLYQCSPEHFEPPFTTPAHQVHSGNCLSELFYGKSVKLMRCLPNFLVLFYDDYVIDLVSVCDVNSPQTSITCIEWDPTGHMLMTCAAGDSHVKVWVPGLDGLALLHDLSHNAAATVIQWCPLLGTGENKHLLLAR